MTCGRLRRLWPALFLALAIAGAGCTIQQLVTPADALPLRFGVVPAIAALPIWAGEHDGTFRRSRLEIEVVAYPSPAERDTALADGVIDGALVDLAAALRLAEGPADARIVRLALVADDRAGHPSIEVVAFRADALGRKGASVRRFLVVYEREVEMLHANPARYVGLLAERGAIGREAHAGVAIPPFPRAGLPEEARVGATARSMLERGELRRAPDYRALVTRAYLPL